MKKKLLIAFCTVAIVIACKKDKVPPVACADNASFATDIVPLMNMNCSTSGCHDANSAQGGYDLTTYASISANADVILAVMNYESGVSPMPQGQPKLADTLIAKFACWSANGALEN